MKYVFVALLLIANSSSANSVRIAQDMISDKESTVTGLSCDGVDVQFARGVRWTPEDYSPVISIGGHSSTIVIPPSCYPEMSCQYYKGKPAVVIVDAPACGGNAVSEEYIVIDINSLHKTKLNFEQARKANLTQD